MTDAGFFRGTSTTQDSRFSDKEKKLLKTMKFPKSFEKKVDMKKVELTVIKSWITKRVTELIGFEDEVVVEFIFSLLEEEKVDPKRSQINITGFLEHNAATFMHELWDLLLSAQDSPNGIPAQFIEQKKQEILKKKKEEEEIYQRIAKEREKEKEYIRDSMAQRNKKETNISSHKEHSTRNIRKQRSLSKSRSRSTSSQRSSKGRFRRKVSRSPSPRHRSRSRERERERASQRYTNRSTSKENYNNRSPTRSNRHDRYNDYNRKDKREDKREDRRSRFNERSPRH